MFAELFLAHILTLIFPACNYIFSITSYFLLKYVTTEALLSFLIDPALASMGPAPKLVGTGTQTQRKLLAASHSSDPCATTPTTKTWHTNPIQRLTLDEYATDNPVVNETKKKLRKKESLFLPVLLSKSQLCYPFLDSDALCLRFHIFQIL